MIPRRSSAGAQAAGMPMVHLLGGRGGWGPWRVLMVAPNTSTASAGVPMLTLPLGMPGGAGCALRGVIKGEAIWALWCLVLIHSDGVGFVGL